MCVDQLPFGQMFFDQMTRSHFLTPFLALLGHVVEEEDDDRSSPGLGCSKNTKIKILQKKEKDCDDKTETKWHDLSTDRGERG